MGSIHYRNDVVHLFFERWRGHSIRQPGAASVDYDNPGESSQFQEEPSDPRLLPEYIEVGPQSWNDYDVPGPIANDLVGDVYTVVTVQRKLGFWNHQPIFTPIELIINFSPESAHGRNMQPG